MVLPIVTWDVSMVLPMVTRVVSMVLPMVTRVVLLLTADWAAQTNQDVLRAEVGAADDDRAGPHVV